MQRLNMRDSLRSALDILNDHARPGVILAPTETVYGLLCARNNAAACERIYALKKRPASKLLANFVSHPEGILSLVPEIPETARIFAEKFCPGPITIVIPDGHGSTCSFRIPDHPFILSLLRAFGKPVASTSANLSGEPPALSPDTALQSLAGEVDLAVDGGILPANSIPSTVVQVNADNSWHILRPGPITPEQLHNALSDMMENPGNQLPSPETEK